MLDPFFGNDDNHKAALQYEDQLPETITTAEYDAWFTQSWIQDGVRVGPKFDKAAQVEAIKARAAPIVGPLDDDELERLAATSPVFWRLVELRASGRIGGRGATNKFLRGLPESLFDKLLVMALSCFRQVAQGVGPLEAAPDLVGCAALLWLEEQRVEEFDGQPDDERLCELARRLAKYALVEESRRAGAYSFVGAYSMSREPSDDWPPRQMVAAIERKTEH